MALMRIVNLTAESITCPNYISGGRGTHDSVMFFEDSESLLLTVGDMNLVRYVRNFLVKEFVKAGLQCTPFK